MSVTDDLDARLERLAENRGVGSLVKTTSNLNKAGEGDDAPRTKPARREPATSKPTATPAPAPRAPTKTLSLEVPDYLGVDLKVKAAHKGTSVRHIILTALKEQGYAIAEIDMVEDGRRLRGSSHE